MPLALGLLPKPKDKNMDRADIEVVEISADRLNRDEETGQIIVRTIIPSTPGVEIGDYKGTVIRVDKIPDELFQITDVASVQDAFFNSDTGQTTAIFTCSPVDVFEDEPDETVELLRSIDAQLTVIINILLENRQLP